MGHHEHDRSRDIGCAVLTVSDTRNAATDASGDLIRSLVEAAGHHVCTSALVRDEPEAIRAAVVSATERDDTIAVLVTGGTGIAPRDVTVDSLRTLWTKELPGFGETFRALSYTEIGPAAILSRATAGVIGGKLVAVVPGSPGGCRLAIERLLLPVLGHVAALLEGKR